MTRKRRDLETSEWFHVSNRGADRQDIFSLATDHQLFESIIEDSILPFDATIHAYAWMTNHFHFVIRAPDQSLSAVMQRIGKRYGAAYNQRTGRTGPVFDHRFHSVPITDDAHFSVAGRYVHRNPLAIVNGPAFANYVGSSLGAYLGKRPTPAWLDTSRLLGSIDPKTYVNDLLRADPDDRLPRFGVPTVRTTTATIDRAVREITGIDAHAERSPSRVLAITMATALRSDDVLSLAEHYRIRPGAVRKSSRRGRVRRQSDPVFEATYDQVFRRLGEVESRMYPVRIGQAAGTAA